MNASEQFIRNAGLARPSVQAVRSNVPAQYADRRYQVFADRRAAFDEERDWLATDFVLARVQGIGENFFDWIETEIRLSDVSTQSVTAFDSKLYDNFKEILFRSRAFDYIPAGALVETMGSMWLVINPGNMSSPTTNAVVARCRAAWRFYDAYGNIRWEPLVIDRATMLSNRNESPENEVMMEGYFNVKCQKNANTVRLRDNQRLILGDYAYHITGYTDFFEEFTGDLDSAHIINFTVRREEPEEHDDLINKIADGLMFSWGASFAEAHEAVPVGESVPFAPQMLLNGVVAPPDADNPQTWAFTSSDEGVATVDESGLVTGVSDGAAIITATLQENPSLTASAAIRVGEVENSVLFKGAVPPSIRQYGSAILSAAYYEGVLETDEPLLWSFSGAEARDYTVQIAEDGKSVVISCESASHAALAVTASHGEYSATAEIILEGY